MKRFLVPLYGTTAYERSTCVAAPGRHLHCPEFNRKRVIGDRADSDLSPVEIDP